MYKSVHQTPTYTQKMYKLYKNCTKLRLKTAWNIKCTFFVHTNDAQTIKMYTNVNGITYAAADVCFVV